MSRAFPSKFAETAAELETWHKNVLELMKEWRGCEIVNDSLVHECRLVPIYLIGPAQRNYWWPLPPNTRTLAEAKDYIARAGLTYDDSRKSQKGFERTLEITL